MSPTEITLIIITTILVALIILGVAARFTVRFFKAHKGGTEFAVMLMFVLAVVMASCACAAHYDLSVRAAAACAILGACGALSVLALLLAFGVTAVSRREKMGLLTATVVVIALLLQVAVSVAHPADFESGEAISIGAIFARIISGTFQNFSLDAGYTEIIAIGAVALPNGATYVFDVLACAMTVIAPIVGGFAIFSALGHFFPKLSLWRSIQPTKYVFSELNEYSIETAESIAALKTKLAADNAERAKYIARYGRDMYAEIMHSVIVFTDVYSDRKDEADAELLDRANKINAICLKDDVLTRKIYWVAGALYRAVTRTKKKVVYFLMDKSDFYVEQGEENNLRTAVSLLSTDKRQMMWAKTHWWQSGMKADSVEIYVFSRSENADAIIAEAGKEWEKQYGKKYSVAFKTINEYQNLVYGLIDGDSVGALPLYTALEQPPQSGKYNTEKLSVLIVGGGRIAKAFLKTAYRCGQMLCGDKPTKLGITVMSLDAEQSEQKLKFDMPAVFDDAANDYDANPNSYCEFRFIPATYGTAEFAESFRTVAIVGGVPDVDYILIALGADNLNMQAADYIRQELNRAGQSAGAKSKAKIIPVNYVIENTALCAALAGDRGQRSGDGICVLNPFGALSERFAFQNVTMTDIERRALAANSSYTGENGKVTFRFDAYGRDSSIAAAMHSAYSKVCISEEDESFERRATWLEHRRWTAYMRSIGYRAYTAREFARLACYKADDEGYMRLVTKDKNLKLHACITECTDKLTTVDDISAFIATHPDFYDIVQDALLRLSGGETLYCNAGGKQVIGVDDFFDYLREKCETDFDNLDILSVMSRGTKTEDGKQIYKLHNYKESDKDIVKRLRLERKSDY